MKSGFPSIGFIVPSLFWTMPDWFTELPWPTISAPTIAGHLRRSGIEDVTLHYFDDGPRRALFDDPSAVRLSVFEDEEAVGHFLAGRAGGEAPRDVTARLLELLAVPPRSVFAISLSNIEGARSAVDLGLTMAMCIATAIKRRQPDATIVVGGCDSRNDLESHTQLLERCPAIDYTGIGWGEEIVLSIARARARGGDLRASLTPGLTFVAHGANRGVIDSREAEARAHARDGAAYEPAFASPFFGPELGRFTYSGARIREHLDFAPELAPVLGEHDAREFTVLPLKFMEGCIYNCAFCSTARSSVKTLTPAAAVEAIRRMVATYGCKSFMFLHNNFNIDYARGEAFLDAMIEADLGVHWSDCFNLYDIDAAFVDKMRRAGVVRAVVGLEYPTDRMLRYMHKPLTRDKIRRGLGLLHDAGIWNHVLLISGFPTETEEDLEELEGWIEETAALVDCYSISPFRLPSTSPMGRAPGRYRLELVEGDRSLGGTYSFNEVGGLPWEAKQDEIVRATERMRAAIRRAKGNARYASGYLDSQRIFYLYRVFGHDRKADIVRAHESTRVLGPLLRRAQRRLEESLLPKLRGASHVPEPEALRVERVGEMLAVELSGRGDGVVRFRCTERDPRAPRAQVANGVAGQSVVVVWDAVPQLEPASAPRQPSKQAVRERLIQTIRTDPRMSELLSRTKTSLGSEPVLSLAETSEADRTGQAFVLAFGSERVSFTVTRRAETDAPAAARGRFDVRILEPRPLSELALDAVRQVAALVVIVLDEVVEGGGLFGAAALQRQQARAQAWREAVGRAIVEIVEA